jgi:hypothetical protein
MPLKEPNQEREFAHQTLLGSRKVLFLFRKSIKVSSVFLPESDLPPLVAGKCARLGLHISQIAGAVVTFYSALDTSREDSTKTPTLDKRFIRAMAAAGWSYGLLTKLELTSDWHLS